MSTKNRCGQVGMNVEFKASSVPGLFRVHCS